MRCMPCYKLEDGTRQWLRNQAMFLHLESGKPPSCRMTAATKSWYGSMIDYVCYGQNQNEDYGSMIDYVRYAQN